MILHPNMFYFILCAISIFQVDVKNSFMQDIGQKKIAQSKETWGIPLATDGLRREKEKKYINTHTYIDIYI